ncbi:ligase-associated DNA damage response DEXH box helicase [Cyclobacterium jeungdonense]|uniref:Ligase-associated DNA damage response DEXH box helicase n=1 Tax=Cyclobacterium jeungdonense TaxID=708087 RepID=A0ABT8CF48_9BACT|nr:ligase-associated DNA damage response DEXH box helicase [Cyclobacterium jeungdonense]MDN3690345.1 ligase-associated DNA damage response DEXH box helicase [Cyclobacterium jeungdonense]
MESNWAENWFQEKGWTPFDFQKACWKHYLQGQSGLLNAPTGSGKTMALWMPVLMEYVREHPDSWKKPQKNGLQVIWITPLRALAQDIHQAMSRVCEETGLPWRIGVRNGDTGVAERQKQKKSMPECLITTPESLHLLLSQKDHPILFKNLKGIIVDEWHELLANKRGIQVQLALSHIRTLTKQPLKIWGISATIGNLAQAHQVLLGEKQPELIVRSAIKKEILVQSILPDEVERYPWAGHLGIKMIQKILPVIEASQSVLLFTNTRSQTEIWYQKILEAKPEWAGIMAMHHGSLDPAVRAWVEASLHDKKLKLVVCTSSLDLGVDFRPVDTVIQVGGPKGVTRFVQRAGRAGHQPGALSRIYFIPTHSLELIEASALRQAIHSGQYEDQVPLENCYDVLIQFLVTLALGEGFYPEQLFPVIQSTHSFRSLSREAFKWMLEFITVGGNALGSYEEFSKVEIQLDGLYKVTSRKTAMLHRLSMGTIVSDPMIQVKFLTGGYIGSVEESFISKLKPGDVFWFAGRSLEFVQIKEMKALVRRSKKKTGTIPRWMGGRMPLSSRLAELIRSELQKAADHEEDSVELRTIQPILALQGSLSRIPDQKSLLVEKCKSKEGYHVFFFPFEGRFVHEVLAALLAYRISVSNPISLSIAMNDYGIELLSDSPIPIEEALEEDLFSSHNLMEDIYASINESEMARRRFREIAAIAGLVFQGYPGKSIQTRHLQATSGILYGVFETYDPDNLLLEQARREVLNVQMEKNRLENVIDRINRQKIHLLSTSRISPFAFPIMVDRLSRNSLSSEKIEDRVLRLQAELLV